MLTIVVLEDVGVVPGGRIEHAAGVPTGVADSIGRLGVRVVTQPGFIADRGDDYRRDLSPDVVACLHPFASLVAAGVQTRASSDVPHGPLDPWAFSALSATAPTRAPGCLADATGRTPDDERIIPV